MTWPHLPKAPIEEALIDIRVTLPAGRALASLRPFAESLATDYPRCRERVAVEGRMSVGPDGQHAFQSASQPDGYLVTSGDGLMVAQARLDGFSFSRLRPYETWEHVRDEARRLWARYLDVAEPTEVTRIAVRYINRLLLRVPVELADFVRTSPTIAPDLPQVMTGVFMQVVLPFPKRAVACVVTQALDPRPLPENEVAYIFDIDAFRETTEPPGDPHLWDVLEELRAVKNEVFFKSMTERALEMFR
jgi:uncharacterized protein (TIGR04255 family)